MRSKLTLLWILAAATAQPASLSWSQAPSPSSQPPASAATQTVKGEVLMATPELCVVRDASGKSTLLTVGKDTAGAATVKVGDQVEAQMAPDGRALSIKAVR
jgi:hypothetical protein